MLFRANGTRFTTGRSQFSDHAEGFPRTNAKVFVKIEPGSLGALILAQLDTGAAYSMLDAEIAEELQLLDEDATDFPISIKTKDGTFLGRLVKIGITLVADEGEALTIEGTVFVSRDWRYGTFLGYAGLLDNLRFALDPSNNSFHFGRH